MKRYLMLLALCVALSACDGSFLDKSWKTMKTAEIVYAGVMESAGDAYKQGLIDDDAKDKIVNVATIYKASFDAAKMALEVYATSNADGESQAKEIAANALAKVITNSTELVTLYSKMTEGIEGVKQWK